MTSLHGLTWMPVDATQNNTQDADGDVLESEQVRVSEIVEEGSMGDDINLQG